MVRSAEPFRNGRLSPVFDERSLDRFECLVGWFGQIDGADFSFMAACSSAGLGSAWSHTRAAWSAATTRSSLNGTRRIRTPVASKIALAIAATVALQTASPAP